MGIIAHDLGMDLGTSNTLVYVKHKGIVVSEPTIAVVEATNERHVRAIGNDAKIMLGRTTEGVMAVKPMREGVITDFDITKILIKYFIRKAIGSSYLVKPRLFLSYPCSISAIERRAVGVWKALLTHAAVVSALVLLIFSFVMIHYLWG